MFNPLISRIKLISSVLAVSAVLSFSAQAQSQQTPAESNPQVIMNTNYGTVMIELYADKAPASVENFLRYVNESFYDDTIFHRVIPNFMVQGGGFTTDLTKKMTHAPVINEADNGLKNTIGTLAMARTNDPHSATAQFFINVSNNSALDHREKSSSRAWGYAVFGRVIKGMKVINKIRAARTGFKNGMGDVPKTNIVINKIRQVK